MAAPRRKDETWPGWAKFAFVVISLVLIGCGIAQIIQARHGEWVLGAISVVAGAMLLVGWVFWPKWMSDPA